MEKILMNKKIIQKALETYNFILGGVDKYGPNEARDIYNKVNYVIITVANYYRLTPVMNANLVVGLSEIYEILFNVDFVKQEEVEYITGFINENNDILNDLVEVIRDSKAEYNIYDLYEELLALDITVSNSRYCVVRENKARDRAGAYYTSKEFASKVVKKTMVEYLSRKLSLNPYQVQAYIDNKDDKIIEILKTSKYTDLSCGTGHFIIPLIEFISNIISERDILKSVLLNIYGFDIDYIALQIIKAELVLYCQDMCFIKSINSNFVLGNTLIDYNVENYMEKIRLVSQGYIYHMNLGINQKKYNEFFDVIIGNPPWEKIRFEDKNFFYNYCPGIADINKKEDRKKEIDKLFITNNKLKEYYDEFIQQIEGCKKQIISSIRLANSSDGELNTYSLFTELAIGFLNCQGCIALIVKSSLFTTAANCKIFNYLLSNNLIISLDDFINRKKIFPIDSRERFTVMILRKYGDHNFKLKMMLQNIEEVNGDNYVIVDKKLLNMINPANNMIPNISTYNELSILINFYGKFETFEKVFPKAKFGRLVHLTSHSAFIHHYKEQNTVPIYEGKFIEIYDSKYSTFEGIDSKNRFSSKATSRIMSSDEKSHSEVLPESRFYIEENKWRDITKNYPYKYSVVWRSLTSATNRRTMIASILPHCPTTQSIQLLQYEDDYKTLMIILALFNSCVFDYLVKLKLSGIDLTQSIIKQIPVPSGADFEKKVCFNGNCNTIENHVFARIQKLYSNDTRFDELFTKLIGYKLDKDTFPSDNKRIIMELDYLVAIAYGLSKEQLTNIMCAFPRFYDNSDMSYINDMCFIE